MRQILSLLLALGIAACAASGSGTPATAPAMGEGACDAAPAQSLIGQAASAQLGADALARTGARTLRWIQPGTMVTMDYRQDRLNIALDDKNRVTRITCG